jgi:O-antigen/teichoic acid export membrane protein
MSGRPPWDLPVRAGCALALVLALTTASGWLGPQLSGLLAPFPIITTVLAAFTLAQLGVGESLRLLRSILGGFVAFALFCFVLTISLGHLGAASAFTLAATVALVAQSVTLGLVRRREAAITDDADLAFATVE